MPTLALDKDKFVNLESKKSAKSPIIYVYLKDIRESLKKIIGPLLEGLAHMDLQVMFDEDQNLEEGLKSANMMLILNEDKLLLKKAWANGVIPITNSFTSELINYNPNTEAGNSFTFENFNEWEIFAAIVRALETYKFPYDWKFIIRSCKKVA